MFAKNKIVLAAVAACGLMLSACGAGGSADGGTVTLRASTPLPPDSSQSVMMDWFLTELEERTNGEVETEIVYGGALVPGDDTLAGLQQNRAEAGLLVPAYFPGDLPLSNINMIPQPGTVQPARGRALQDLYTEDEGMAEELERNQVVLLGYLANTTSTVAVRGDLETLDDFDGMRLRIPSQPQSVVFSELGAEPMFMATEEIYEAIERGIVDGTTFPFDVQISNGVTEVAKTMAPDVGQNGGAIFAMSQNTYDRLSDDAKAVVEELQDEWAAKQDELLTEFETDVCTAFLDSGGTVVNWTDSEQERLSEIVEREAVDLWKSEAVSTGADQAQVDELWTSFSENVESLADEADYTDVMETCGQ